MAAVETYYPATFKSYRKVVGGMCSEEHNRHVKDLLEKIVKNTAQIVPSDFIIQISASTPWVIDYRERKHIFIYSANALTLTLEDIGSLTIGSDTWINFSFSEGMRVFASGQNSTVPIFVRCTNETQP